MIGVNSKGNFQKTRAFLDKMQKKRHLSELNRYGELGVKALAANTPVDTGKTALSWRYRIVRDRRGVRIEWYNTNVKNRVPVAVLIQYGHGNRSGGYVQGRDYINPAMRPIFDNIARDVWKKVKE